MPSRDDDTADAVCCAELHTEARRRLSEEERELLDRRAAGQDWSQIASEVGSSPDAARKQLERAIRRVCAQLGLDAAPHESARRNQAINDAPLPLVPGYQATRRLGKGARGTVFEARQLSLRRQVALKVISRDKARLKSEARDSFRREAEAIARLQHPNIVQIFDFGEIDNEPFCVMELMDGGSLQDKLAAGPQPPIWVAAMMEQLARAVHIMHDAGIVHRDLKPSNVLLTKSGLPKIADFGLCNLVGDDGLAPSHGIYGTPGYMAPEQASESELAGPSADVYALGVILYESLTGSLPFVGNELWEMLSGEHHREPIPPIQIRPDVPHDLNLICMRCLRNRAEERFASAGALAAALLPFLHRKDYAHGTSGTGDVRIDAIVDL